jgi:NAD(P)H-hydrate epimerase
VDRIAVEDFGLGILQTMENAGRNLALNVIEMLAEPEGGTARRPERLSRGHEVVILADSGGNGGGGLCCARHLHNRGFPVWVVLTREAEELRGPAAIQLRILQSAGVEPVMPESAAEVVMRSRLVVDALIGCSPRGAPTVGHPS